MKKVLIIFMIVMACVCSSCSKIQEEPTEFQTIGYERVEFDTVQRFEYDTMAGYVMIVKDTATNTEYMIVTRGESIAVTQIGDYIAPETYDRSSLVQKDG